MQACDTLRVRVFADGVLQDWLTTDADAIFWAEGARREIAEGVLSKAIRGDIGQLGPILVKHLPRDGMILDAGCGAGRVVAALRALGFDCVGIDSSQECVAAARQVIAGLPVETGNICRLKWGHDTVAGYVSMGVIEHDPAGPERALREAYRVLKPGGIAVIGVPTVNPLRDLKKAFGLYPHVRPRSPYRFYEYVFSRRQFRTYLSGAGFKIRREYSIAAPTGLDDEFTLIERMRRRCPLLWACIVGPWHVLPFLRRLVGHMVVYVAAKAGLPPWPTGLPLGVEREPAL